MKKLLVLFFVSLLSFSCSKDDSEQPMLEKIIGSWEFSDFKVAELLVKPIEFNLILQAYLDKMDINDFVSAEDLQKMGKISFDSQGNCSFKDENGEEVMKKYELQGDLLTIEDELQLRIGFDGNDKLLFLIDLTKEIKEGLEAEEIELPNNFTISKIVFKIIFLRK